MKFSLKENVKILSNAPLFCRLFSIINEWALNLRNIYMYKSKFFFEGTIETKFGLEIIDIMDPKSNIFTMKISKNQAIETNNFDGIRFIVTVLQGFLLSGKALTASWSESGSISSVSVVSAWNSKY